MQGTFDFTKCLSIFEDKGKDLYNPEFRIHPEDYETIFQLLAYFLRDSEKCQKYAISPQKGIILSGPIGCGKTSIMNLIRLLLPQTYRYTIKSCRDVSFEFIQDGYGVIRKYSNLSFIKDDPKIYCFDDIGTENNLKFYGNECNVMAEILLSRYDLFISKRMITHLTTNLDSNEIEDMYGTRVRSRLREMFNLIAFDFTSKDKRC